MTFYQRKLKETRESCYSNQAQLQAIIATRRYIDMNVEQDLNLDVLASSQSISKFHLQRLFKRYYGQTPRQYLIDKRIQKSKEYLKKGMSVTETCFAVGFESLGSFSKLFKTKTGIPPSQFKKAQVSRSA